MIVLAALSYVIDVRNHRRAAYLFVVVGMNSIAAYLIAELLGQPVRSLIRAVAGHFVSVDGSATAIVGLGAIALAIYWLILWAMYRRKIFLRI